MMITACSTGTVPSVAHALKDRNEALCSTGFFTNIALYKCTEIGDISDEGKSRSLSNEQQGRLSSLMDKMGLDEGKVVDKEEEESVTVSSEKGKMENAELQYPVLTNKNNSRQERR